MTSAPAAGPLHAGSLPLTDVVADLLQWLWPAASALPAPVRRRVQRLWVDTAACAWSGLAADRPRRWLEVQAEGDAGSVTLPGSPIRLAAGAAASAFALGACWDEACAGLALAHGRPGVPIVAALWTEVASRQPSWESLWQSTAVGYEVAARLGARLRIRPGMHVDGVWGAFGAAVALVHLRGGSWRDALGAIEACAVQLPYTLVRPVRQGAELRNLYLGHSAWLGLQAANAVAAGFATTEGAVDDVADFMLDPAAAGDFPPPGDWLILASYWKPFAAVRHLHYGAQAAIDLRAQGLDPNAVDAIELRIYPEALHYCANRSPQTLLAAQFSLSFGVAAALAFGDLSPAEFRAPRFFDPLLRRLEAMVEVAADAHTFAGRERGATLSVRSQGRWWRVDQGPVAGDPGQDPDDAEVEAKFDRFTRHDAAMSAWARRVAQDPAQAQACLPEPSPL